MMEANESLNLQDLLAYFQFPAHEYMNDKNGGTDESLSNRPGTSHTSVVNAGNQNVERFNLEELDESLSDEVGILDSSDLSSDDLSVSEESEYVSGCSSFDSGSFDISDENSDDNDIPLEDCGIDLEGFTDSKLLKSALAANRNLQKKLSEALEKIQDSLNKKEALMKEFQKAKDDEIAMRAYREPKLPTQVAFLSPYFCEPGDIKMCPPCNEDTLAKLKNNEITAYQQPALIWTPYETKRLLQGVYEVALDYVLKPHNLRVDFLKEKMADQRKAGTLIKYREIEMKEEILRIKYTMKQIRTKSTAKIIEEAGDNIDWMRVSKQFFDGKRSEENCELRWKNFQSISVNKKPFTQAEDNKLEKLVKTHHEKNWDLIAEELQTGRTAFQCCRRYQSHINKNIEKKGYFTYEESAKLLKIVEELRSGDFIPWQQVQLYIEGRKSSRIATHYKNVVKEALERSPFTKEEDALILACAKKFEAKSWRKTHKYLPHRSFPKIQRRYEWFLNPNMKLEPWSAEENFKLIKLVKKYGFGKWAEIAKQLPGRPNIAIRKHINTLLTRDKNTKVVRFKSPEEVKEISKSSNNFQRYCANRRKHIIKCAHEALKSALDKIYYHLKEPLTLDNLSSISFPGLRLLQKELMKRRKKSIKWNINMNWRTTFPIMEREVHDNESMSDSEDEAEMNIKKYNEIESNWANPQIIIQNSYINSKVKELEEDEKAWLQKVLHSQIMEEANREPVPYNANKIIGSLGLASTVEYSLYEGYLHQQMACSKTASKEVNDNICILNERDYKTTLPEVLHYFVAPPASEDHVLILPPNFATLDAMNEILASDSKLHKTANLADHSIRYIRYLLYRSENKPMCVRCSQVGNAETSHEKYKAALATMKSNLIVPTSEMKKSAMIETKFPAVQCKECCCDKLLESKATVDLLFKRFMALFFWPYMLQLSEPRKQQMELVFRSRRYKNKMKKLKKQHSRRNESKCESDAGSSNMKQPREGLEWTESEEESDRLSCSSPTTMQGSESQSQTAQNEIEVISLSDTYEDFPYVEPMETEL